MTEYDQWINDEALNMGLKDREDLISDRDLSTLVEELCAIYQVLKREQVYQQNAYMPGTEWEVFIKQRKNIFNLWQQKDVNASCILLKNFWRNELGPIVKQYATFDKLISNNGIRESFIDSMAHDYMIWSNLFNADPEELTIPCVGNPWGYLIDQVLIAPKALRYHALKTQIINMLSDIDRPIIAEIGGGYGGLAFYLLNSEKPLVYINFDLPETLIINTYYLKRTLPQKKILTYEPGLMLDMQLLDEVDAILMPNWVLPTLPSGSVDLFVNTFSLSEVPLQTLCEYIAQIERCCRGYFLHNNMDRKNVFNLGFERIPCSEYPIGNDKFKTIYKRYDLFQRKHYGKDGDYREVLYQRI